MNTNQSFGVSGDVAVFATNFPVRSVFFRDTPSGLIEVYTREDALLPEVSEMEFLGYTKEAFQSMILRNPQALLVKMSSSDIAYSRTMSQDAIRNALKLDLIYPEPSFREPERSFFGRIFSCIWEEDPPPLPIMKRVSRPALHLPSDATWTGDGWGSDVFDNYEFVEVDIPSNPAKSRIDHLLDRLVRSLGLGFGYPADARISACATGERFIVGDDMLFLMASSAGKKYLVTLAELKKIDARAT